MEKTTTAFPFKKKNITKLEKILCSLAMFIIQLNIAHSVLHGEPLRFKILFFSQLSCMG